MRLSLFFLISFLAFGTSAKQCAINYDEAKLIQSIKVEPVQIKTFKEDDLTKRQFEFRKELSGDELLSDDADSKYQPQFYVTINHPSCPDRVKIWFYEDNDNTKELPNTVLAGRAYRYLSGLDEAIFANKMKKFSDVTSFESYDERANSKFLKVGNIYSIDVFLQ